MPTDETNEPISDGVLEEGGEAQLVVNLRRVNPSNARTVLMSNFPKVKEMGWFLVVANPDTEEVICLKRISFKRMTSKTMNIVLPNDFETPIQVMLLSDSYIGLDQSYVIDLARVNKRLEANVKVAKKSRKKS